MVDHRPSVRPPARHERVSSEPVRPKGMPLRTRDGRPLLLREIDVDDVAALRRAFDRLTPEQIRLRVFHALKELPEPIAAYMCRPNPEKVAAFVVTDPDGLEIRGEARVHFDHISEDAEFAIIIDPAFTGQGVGFALMTRLIAVCRERGMRSIWGDVLSENMPMLDLTDRFGFSRRGLPGEPGVLRTELSLLEAPRSDS